MAWEWLTWCQFCERKVWFKKVKGYPDYCHWCLKAKKMVWKIPKWGPPVGRRLNKYRREK